ncbi:hypothetical protein HYW44_05465 [Candidatus Daviesbacteria bacterium]|nr:hypothetical protein [Candidatus Daviesbacteria bacterium]
MTGKQFAIIATITFIVGMIWLVSDIIFNTKPSIPSNPQLETLLKPINPNYNPRVLEVIDREVIDPHLVQSASENSPQASSPNAAQTEISTQSGQTRR